MPQILITKFATTINEWLSSQTQHTRRAYETDLREFAKETKAESWLHAIHQICSSRPADARKAVEAHLRRVAPRLAQSTVRRRMSTFRAAVAAARKDGLLHWTLELEEPKPKSKKQAAATAPRSMEGIDLMQLRRLREALELDQTKAGLRDRAIIELAAVPPYLRRSEIVFLDVGHVDLVRGRLKVLGKGRREFEEMMLSPIAGAAIKAWLDVRGGSGPDPLFIRLDRGAKANKRLSDHGVWAITMARGAKSGIGRVRPHGLRHHGITELANFIDERGLPVGEGMKLSRHAKEETYRRYIDRTGSQQEKIVAALARRTKGG